MTQEMVACRGCGKEIHRTASTCPQCGAPQRTKRYKSKTAAGVLAILIGGLGVHRFYLGQWWGIFYLLLFWTWIPGIISIVEGIVFLFRNDEKWDAQYNEGIPGKGEGSVGVIVAAVVGAIVVVMFIGILAAIAIPAYQDYTVRARVAGAMVLGAGAKQRVEQYMMARKSWPTTNAEAGMSDRIDDKYVAAMNIGEGGVITVQLSDKAGPASGKTLVFSPHIDAGILNWSCDGGTLDERYRPRECRKGNAR
jgi:TM2 domain-containing membrane protein YozV/Tfp pilus assembly major pilin PilA